MVICIDGMYINLSTVVIAWATRIDGDMQFQLSFVNGERFTVDAGSNHERQLIAALNKLVERTK